LSYYQEFIAQRRDDPGAQAHLLETTKRVEKILADLAMLRAAGQLNLLSQPPVLEDLRLNEEQRAKVKDLSARVTKQWKESLSDIGRRSGAERGRRSLEQARANEADVKATLTSEQLRRLHQIGLQSDALGAFREPEVAIVLQLTAEQRERIRTIEEEAFMGRLRTFWPDLPPGDSGKVPEPKNKPPHERIVEVLTEEQARKWR